MRYSNLRPAFQECIRAAGALAMSYYGRPLMLTQKQRGFFTQADTAVEQFLMQQLNTLLPEASFYTEESGSLGRKSAVCWVIDPIDGTTNFVRGIPYFCISVALTVHDEPVMAVIYQPVLDELFYAEQGGGAWCNDKRLLPAQAVQTPFKVLITSANGALRAAEGERSTLRYFGAAALDCAYLASGRVDGLEFSHVAWWDIAAGVLLLKEAQVKVAYKKRIGRDGQTVYTVRAGFQALCGEKS